MSHLYAPTPNPRLSRVCEKDREWTKRTLSVCRGCNSRGCSKCAGTGFVRLQNDIKIKDML